MLVGVMDDTERCPYEDAPIQPRTLASLTSIGVKMETDIILEVDWRIIAILMAVLVGCILVFVVLFVFYTKVTWGYRSEKKVGYRKQNEDLDVKGAVGNRLIMNFEITG
jgi:hypothetical protein